LMLDNFSQATDESKRLLYVAMTRAKQNLTIHMNSNYLDNLSANNLERIEDRAEYLPPNEMVMQLTHKDVWLDDFIYRQNIVSQFISGDQLIVKENECVNSKGKVVLKFSRQYVRQIESLERKCYVLARAKVNFIVYWQKEGSDKEVKIILPELYFEKKTDEG
jgi:ATP-dependent DNA helicase RecQ